jgi:bifunctional non-homologous end joining protein LigD
LNIVADFTMDGECIGDRFHVFDLLTLNSEDLRSLGYLKRWHSLVTLLGIRPDQKQTGYISTVITSYSTEYKWQIWEMLHKTKAEGAVFKRLDAPYTAGRPSSGGTQLKHKFYVTMSAVVGKVNQQRSVEIVLLYKDGWHTAGNVTIPSNHDIPAKGTVIEIRYLYAFKESGIVYQPTYLGARTDIEAMECLSSQLKFKRNDEDEG